MLYLTRIPRPPLCEFVSSLWYCECEPLAHRRERVLPNGCIQIIIDLEHDHIPGYGPDGRVHEVKLPAAIVAGARSEFEVIDTRTMFRLAGVRFRPGGAAPFLHIPAHETYNRDLGLEDVWGREAREIRERLGESERPEQIFDSLEAALLRRAMPGESGGAMRCAVGLLESPAASVSEVAGSLGYSSKQFIQRFREQVGMTPKVYQRLRRFQRAVAAAHAGKTVNWARLAADCGYSDQPHFVREFRAFAGVNPTEYARDRGVWANHIPWPE